MAIHVRYFARLRDLVGASEATLSPAGVADAAGLIERLAEGLIALGRPDAAEALRHASVRVEVNGVIGPRSARVKDGDEVALLPPFSGG